jgi:hypothetical protein
VNELPANPALGLAIRVLREEEDPVARAALDQAVLFSRLIVPADATDQADDGEPGDYVIRAVENPRTGEPALPAFSGEAAYRRWEGQSPGRAILMPGPAVLDLVIEDGMSALVLDPDLDGAIVLDRETVEEIRASASGEG